MRKLLLGAAAALAIAAPGVASAQTGYFGGFAGNVDVDGVGDADVYGVEVATTFDGGMGGLNFAVDGSIASSDPGDDAVSIGGHLYGQSDTHLFGGFLGYVDGSGTQVISGGFEGLMFHNAWTFGGAVGYAQETETDIDGFGANGQANYFFNPNLRAHGGVGWFQIDDINTDAVTYTAGVEGALMETPFSLGVNYAATRFDDLNIDSDAWTVTLRYNFGGSLQDRTNSGAGLAGLSSLGSIF